MSVAEQIAWLANRLALAPGRADALAAEVTTDPAMRKQIAADILRGLTTDYASDLRALGENYGQGAAPVTKDQTYLARLEHVVAAVHHLEQLQRLTADPGQRARIAALGHALGELLRPASGLTEQVAL